MIQKVGEVENKIPDLDCLVKKTIYDAKFSKIERKYCTNYYYNKLTKKIFDAKINEKELVEKSDVSNLVKNTDLNTKPNTLVTKAELKAEHDKIVKLKTHNLSYFLDDGFQNMFVNIEYVRVKKIQSN